MDFGKKISVNQDHAKKLTRSRFLKGLQEKNNEKSSTRSNLGPILAQGRAKPLPVEKSQQRFSTTALQDFRKEYNKGSKEQC